MNKALLNLKKLTEERRAARLAISATPKAELEAAEKVAAETEAPKAAPAVAEEELKAEVPAPVKAEKVETVQPSCLEEPVAETAEATEAGEAPKKKKYYGKKKN